MKINEYHNKFINMYGIAWHSAPIETIDWFLGNHDIDIAKRLLKRINRDRMKSGSAVYYVPYGHRLF